MRLELFKRTDLSLRALERLAESDGGMAGAELASLIGTSAHYVPQVMKPLVGAGWVKATSGPHGGYSFQGDLERLSVLDVVEAVEGQPTTGNVY